MYTVEQVLQTEQTVQDLQCQYTLTLGMDLADHHIHRLPRNCLAYATIAAPVPEPFELLDELL